MFNLAAMKNNDQKRVDVYPPENVTLEWVFYVPVNLFAGSLDICAQTLSRTYKYKNSKHKITCATWTRGVPPAFSFEVGSVFYTSYDESQKPWRDLEQARVLQIRAVEADHVTFDDFVVHKGSIATSAQMTCLQVDFERILKFG